jgi:acyl dehydratase
MPLPKKIFTFTLGTKGKGMGKGKGFTEIQVGDSAEFEVIIDEQKHVAFAHLISDFSPIHTSEAFSSETRFKKPIGYAFLLTAYLSRLYGEYLPGGSSICIKQEAKFMKPYYPGDTLRIRGEVIHKVESTRFVEIKSEAFRNSDEKIFEGLGIVQIIHKNPNT